MCVGGLNCSGNNSDVKKIEKFYHKSMRQALKIPMKRVIEEEKRNSKIREWFGGVEDMACA